MKKQTFVFLGFFFEALKPYASSILDTAVDIADAAVSASTRLEVRATEMLSRHNDLQYLHNV